MGENSSLKGKERRKNCLCLWKRREDEGWWDVSSLTPLKFSGKSWIITGCCWEARQGADTSSVGSRNAGWGVGRTGGGGHLCLSHVRALDSAQLTSELLRCEAPGWWGWRRSGVEKADFQRLRGGGGRVEWTCVLCRFGGEMEGAWEAGQVESSFLK